MNPTLLKILASDTLFLLIGVICGFIIAVFVLNSHSTETNEAEDEEEDEETIDEDGELDGEGHIYYVKLPDSGKVINIEIEDPIGVDHIIVLDNIKYKVSMIEHKVEGHTIIHLSHTHAPIF